MDLEIVRQTLIAAGKMKTNGDCITEEELGDAVIVSIYGGSNENAWRAMVLKYLALRIMHAWR